MKDTLSSEDVKIYIVDCQVRSLSNKEVSSVKVLWSIQSLEVDTWKAEVA